MRIFLVLSLIFSASSAHGQEEPNAAPTQATAATSPNGSVTVQSTTSAFYFAKENPKPDARVDENGILYLRENEKWRKATDQEAQAIYMLDSSLLNRENSATTLSEQPPPAATTLLQNNMKRERLELRVEDAYSGDSKNPVTPPEPPRGAVGIFFSKIFQKQPPAQPKHRGPGLIIKARQKKIDG